MFPHIEVTLRPHLVFFSASQPQLAFLIKHSSHGSSAREQDVGVQSSRVKSSDVTESFLSSQSHKTFDADRARIT